MYFKFKNMKRFTQTYNNFQNVCEFYDDKKPVSSDFVFTHKPHNVHKVAFEFGRFLEDIDSRLINQKKRTDA